MDDLTEIAAVSKKIAALDVNRAELVQRRNQLLDEAYRGRWSWADMQRATGLTRKALDLIVRGINGGTLPRPGRK